MAFDPETPLPSAMEMASCRSNFRENELEPSSNVTRGNLSECVPGNEHEAAVTIISSPKVPAVSDLEIQCSHRVTAPYLSACNLVSFVDTSLP
jgi:hypothetical protein